MSGDLKKTTISKMEAARSELYWSLMLMRKLGRSLQGVIKDSNLDFPPSKARAKRAVEEHLADFEVAKESLDKTLALIKALALNHFENETQASITDEGK